jgi:hypothetical protein
VAERKGFEPLKGYKPLLVFKTSAFNRSAISPYKILGQRLLTTDDQHSLAEREGFEPSHRVNPT